MSEAFVQTQHSEYFVRSAGTGPAIVLGHSLTFDADLWEPQVRALSTRFKVVAIDLPGHGRTKTSMRDFTLDDVADDVAELIGNLDLGRVGYCGISMGGMVGMRLAIRHSQRLAALVLMNTSGEAEPDAQRQMYHQINESTRGKDPNTQTVNFLVNLMFSATFREAHPDVVKKLSEKLWVKTDDPLYFAGKAVIWRSDVLDELKQLDLPTLVITSDKDASIPMIHGRRLHEAIPNSAFWMIAGAGHLTNVECAEAVNARLIDFFSEHMQDR